MIACTNNNINTNENVVQKAIYNLLKFLILNIFSFSVFLSDFNMFYNKYIIYTSVKYEVYMLIMIVIVVVIDEYYLVSNIFMWIKLVGNH